VANVRRRGEVDLIAATTAVGLAAVLGSGAHDRAVSRRMARPSLAIQTTRSAGSPMEDVDDKKERLRSDIGAEMLFVSVRFSEDCRPHRSRRQPTALT
jgi:hypothetical protein